MSRFDEEPDGDIHGECAEEIARLRIENEALRAFVKLISEQKPEKPDYWSSCSQCERNADEAKDLLAMHKSEVTL